MGTLATAADGGGMPGGTVTAFIITIIGIGLYWLPSLIAWRRHAPGPVQVIVVNFFAFLFLVPWVIALVMAFRAPRPLPRRPVSRSAGG